MQAGAFAYGTCLRRALIARKADITSRRMCTHALTDKECGGWDLQFWPSSVRSHAAQNLLLAREALHADSVVIITSRSTALLRESGAHMEEVALLPQAQAEELFASYAFDVDARPAAVRERAAQVVELCDGLPLTIKVRACHCTCRTSSR